MKFFIFSALTAFLFAAGFVFSPATPLVSQPAYAASNVLVVKVHADWCPACKNIAPAWNKVEKQFKGQAKFVVLDVTNKENVAVSEGKAKALGITSWFNSFKSRTSTVAVMDGSNGKVLKLFFNESNPDAYAKVIGQALK